MKIKFKKLHPDAVIPSRAYEGDAGLDLVAINAEEHGDMGFVTYKTGLAIEIPEGYYGLIAPRSSIYKKGLRICNSPGTIDSRT